MKVVQMNSVCGRGSTGRISVEISKILSDNGIENKILYFDGKSKFENSERFSNYLYIKFQALRSRIFGEYGFNSRCSTKKVIKYLEEFRPDIVHIHNLHGHDVNIKTLFDYLRENNIQVVWTFHDCWPFTGYCTYFTFNKCEKWKIACEKCPERRKYSYFTDKSRRLYERKKAIASGGNITVVTPSRWLADLTRESIFKNTNILVINNGIDLSAFKPTESDFRKRYGVNDGQTLILGVAFDWEKRKGLDVFLELNRRLSDDYKIVLVGTNKTVDKLLPDNIISIHRTNNTKELAEIYTAADVFLNPTREENFPTVNMESLACGTPVVTFETGGSPEIIDETCGAVVAVDDICGLVTELKNIHENKPYHSSACEKRASKYNKKQMYEEYLDLYKKLFSEASSKTKQLKEKV